ncbi:membrane-spanning permease [Clostridium botulinum]|uniref:membrane-spanning permease n=1 Tax=Clostridium botulinum TaxID=1491 RepID=UPI003DA6AE66
MIRKTRELNYKYICIIIPAIIAILNILDTYNFLYSIGLKDSNISFQDVVSYTIYGLNTKGGTNFIDILKFSIPYLFIIFLSGMYIKAMFEDGKKYINLIRYKSYKLWARKNILSLFLSGILIFTLYYVLLIIVGLIYIKNHVGITKVFLQLNPNCDYSISFYKIILLQYLIGIFLILTLISIQLLVAILLNNTVWSFMCVTLVLLVFSFLGKYNIYNPFMLSKHNFIDSMFRISPFQTVASNIIIIILLYLSIIKLIKSVVRRDKI